MRVVLLAIIVAFLPVGGAAAADRFAASGKSQCPETREFLAPELKIRPGDGDYYRNTLRSMKMKISDVLRYLGGPKRTREIAEWDRDMAEKRLTEGADGAEKRYSQDTVLRADALLRILDCLEVRNSI